MRFKPTDVFVATLIDPDPHRDDRGRLMRVWCGREFAECRIDFTPVQANMGFSARKGTIGLSEGRLLRRDIAKHNMVCLADVDALPVTGLAETL